MKKHKSILIIGNYPPPFGGVPRHIEYLAPYLVEKGWDVHILSGGGSGIEYKDGITIYKPNRILRINSLLSSLCKPAKAKHFKFKSIIRKYPREWLHYQVYTSIGRRIIEREGINIISAYNLYSYAPVGAVLAEQYNIPLVVNNLGEIYNMPHFFEKNIGMVKYICHVAVKLIAPTHHCAESYKVLGLSPEVEVIHHAIDVKAFSPSNDGARAREKLGMSNNDNIVLFVGRMVKDMGLHTLLEAIPQVLQIDNKAKFLIVGQKGELLHAAFESTERYKGSVFVLPDVPLEELPCYYAASTIIVAPTQGDRACGSLAAAEAMATGKPVIASRVGGIPEFVIDGRTGILIPPEDSSALGEAILSLLNNESLIKKMGECGRVRVETLWDKDEVNPRMEQVFREVLEENLRAGHFALGRTSRV